MTVLFEPQLQALVSGVIYEVKKIKKTPYMRTASVLLSVRL